MSHYTQDIHRPRQRRYEAPADVAMSHAPSNERVSLHPPTRSASQVNERDFKQETRTLRVFLPSTLPSTSSDQGRCREIQSWRDLVPNPLNGVVGDPIRREEYQLYCDPCQKGFHSKERYDKHMEDHIWCTHPGCKFSCRRGKEWKMELHVETLHNRPDAPNLADVTTYLSQRKTRFPTQNTVKSKVEELFYKASRGVELPDERRRWLRQHGVLVRKHPRSDETYIAADALQPSRATGSKSLQQKHQQQHQQRGQQQGQHPHEQKAKEEGQALDDPTAVSDEPVETLVESVSGDHHPRGNLSRQKRVIPLGPNGTLTRGQKVQLIREKYRDAKLVPRFYVCHRCGAKGSHWVDSCPHRDDETFGRHMVWGEERRDPPRPRHRGEPCPGAGEGQSEEPERAGTQALGPDEGGGPPEEQSARRNAAISAGRDVTSVMAPVAAAAAKGRRRGDTHQQQQQQQQQQQEQQRERRHARTVRPRQPPPTLFGRLCESENVNEQGLLLQAIRFFVLQSFFES